MERLKEETKKDAGTEQPPCHQVFLSPPPSACHSFWAKTHKSTHFPAWPLGRWGFEEGDMVLCLGSFVFFTWFQWVQTTVETSHLSLRARSTNLVLIRAGKRGGAASHLEVPSPRRASPLSALWRSPRPSGLYRADTQ